MMIGRITLAVCLLISLDGEALAAQKGVMNCGELGFNVAASKSLSLKRPEQKDCQVQTKGTLELPDPKCTPGAINPSLTAKILRNPKFNIRCLQWRATSQEEKASTYESYGIKEPQDNRGKNQFCELDHLVSTELGGADTLDNIWPQCGPPGASLQQRFFKKKDLVENCLFRRVKSGEMHLSEVQRGIAEDWTQYLEVCGIQLR